MKAKTLAEQIDGLRCAVEFMATSLYGNQLSEKAVMKILEYTDKRKPVKVKITEIRRVKK